ncbi:MAG: PQQ-binding-like beta-propeller repeat protein [Bacteroidales bacterium]|nr:PQQ-binding-like beta-propeller repeat protein [Bacteroidales bacterium]
MVHTEHKETLQKPLRLWPGIIIAILILLVRYILPAILPEALIPGIFGGLAAGLLVIVWWAFFSRATSLERWIGPLIFIVAPVVASLFLHESIAKGGQGMMFTILWVPVMSLVFVTCAVITSTLSPKTRLWSIIASIILASGVWILLRNDGITGDFSPDLVWRWSQTSEERLISQDGNSFQGLETTSVIFDSVSEWPGFRGPNRDGVVHGLAISTDWTNSPPEELWRRAVGPGCSSFAVNGDYFFTQEQRGEQETVTCYYLNTGEPVWIHRDSTRFWDSHAGAGPRATPTLHNGRVYTMGGTGILNALDATDGSLIWSRNAAADCETQPSGWGYTSSPLVVDSLVIVGIVGKLAAYDLETGDPIWFGPDGGFGYSSPQLFTIEGAPQVILMSQSGAISIGPASGKILWEYPWPVEDRILQPALIEGGDLLLCKEYNEIRRVSVLLDAGEYSTKDRWTSSAMKVDFNDQVVHNGYAYGYDGPYLTCIDLNDGKRMWRGDRYRGWNILLAGQDLVLILTEKGDLALVQATPDKFTELGKIKAIEGRTWNHPAVAGDVVLVRNSEEMAAFKLKPSN